MSDIKELLPESPDDERIRKWREERHRVAQAEKAERLRQRDEVRAREAEEQAERDAAAAVALLPSDADIAAGKKQLRRQRAHMRLRLATRFSLICLLPLVATFYYLTAVATPLYEARSVIAVTKPSGGSDASNSGLLGSLSSPTPMQEVFMAHEFIQSQAMMDALEDKTGLVTHLSSAEIDPIQRLRDIDALDYGKDDQFARFVESAVNIQTGLITLYVRTPDPAESVAVSDEILGLVANQVNTLNVNVIEQRRALADQTVSAAQDQLTRAQSALTSLQLESGEADPAERIAGVYAIIQQLEDDAMAVVQDIQKAEVTGQSQSFQNQRAIELQSRIEAQIAEQRARLVSGKTATDPSLNTLMMQHQLAELRVEIAEKALTASFAAQADATQAAALARSLFQVVVPPRTSNIAGTPNAPAVLLMVFLVSLAVFAFWTTTFVGRRAF